MRLNNHSTFNARDFLNCFKEKVLSCIHIFAVMEKFHRRNIILKDCILGLFTKPFLPCLLIRFYEQYQFVQKLGISF